MRVSSSSFQPSLICCSKSSVRHSPPYPPKRKPGDSHNVFSSPSPVPFVMERDSFDEKVKFEQNSVDDGKVDILPKSSMKKPGSSNQEQACKGNVKWMDSLGKELVQIREFEPSEFGESDDDIDGNTSCTCTIQ